MSFKDDLKSIIIESGWTITQVVAEINRMNGTYTSVQNFSSKMIRETFKYTEVEQILGVIGYQIQFAPINTTDPESQIKQRISRISRGNNVGGVAYNVIGNTPMGVLGNVVNVSKHLIDKVREVVDEEYYKKYIENSQERNKILSDLIEKQLLDIINMDNKDKEGD